MAINLEFVMWILVKEVNNSNIDDDFRTAEQHQSPLVSAA